MTQRNDQLGVYLDARWHMAAARLARQLNVSSSYLGRHAIRQLLIRSARGDVIELRPDLVDGRGRQLVTLGADELAQLRELASRIGTTAELIGQHAYRDVLDQAAGGAVPMIALEEEPERSALELGRMGRHVSHIRFNEESDEERADLQAKINTLDAEMELARLQELTSKDRT